MMCSICGSSLSRRNVSSLCRKHFAAILPRPRKVPVVERFWRRVDKTGDCWLWIGRRNRDGYGLCVLHKCDNPPCVRPDHLFVGTQQENVMDMHEKGRDRWSRA